MSVENKAAQLITKLLRETGLGLVNWQIMEPPYSLRKATEDVVPLYLQANYKGTLIGIYERRYKSYYDYDENSFNWTDTIGFCVVNIQGNILWEVNEYSPALLDLFNAAREKASGIDSIFDALLNS